VARGAPARLPRARVRERRDRQGAAARGDLDSGVHALLDLYRIGAIRRLDFKGVWGIAVEPRPPGAPRTADSLPLTCLELAEFYRRWVRYLYRVVEVENSLHNNLSLRRAPLVEREPPDTMTKLKARVMLESRGRDQLVGALLRIPPLVERYHTQLLARE
jgi:hypothetical protein